MCLFIILIDINEISLYATISASCTELAVRSLIATGTAALHVELLFIIIIIIIITLLRY